MVRMVTVDDILAANRYGLRGGQGSYWTPVLDLAARLGNRGIDLSAQPVVEGWRFGDAPDSGISANYRDQTSERGLSLAGLGDGTDLACTSMAVILASYERPIRRYRGVLLPYRGSDGEPLILMIGGKMLD